MNFARTLALLALGLAAGQAAADIWEEVEHGYADNDGVSIHYTAIGEGPPVVMIHGFPDFWYSWRHQMEGLADNFQVVAIDQRGYNRSGAPEGQENYDLSLLIGDVAAVIRALGHDSATIVGHDWGGAVAWQFAFALPQMVDRLIVLNLPHPNGFGREMAGNEEQQRNSGYARAFQIGNASDPDIFFGGPMTPETLSGWVSDAEARAHYIEAFGRSDFDAMLAYYKQNYPSGDGGDSIAGGAAPQLDVPLLLFHGLEDTALHSNGLNNTWDWNDGDTTIVAVPGAGHFVQQDAADLVTETMRWWLLARQD